MRVILELMFLMGSLLMLLLGIRLIVSYQQAQYIKSHYNIEVSTKDIFWNEKLVMSELRSKGIITDNNENNNVKIIKE
tara:strand:- start:10113 stop:10346 length:234 start_codon:yes stop_codon:yes gene_type:complete